MRLFPFVDLQNGTYVRMYVYVCMYMLEEWAASIFWVTSEGKKKNVSTVYEGTILRRWR
jgi:hypothetical protein